MKILESYKKIMNQFIDEADVDDDKMIKYKKKDGEQGEMKASSAKTMPKDHPAKLAYDVMKGDDSKSDDEKPGKVDINIDANPFDNEKPGGDSSSSDSPKDKNAFDTANDYEPGTRSPKEAANVLGNISQDIESGQKMNRTAALEADEAMQDVMDQYGIRKNKAGGFSTEEYDDATDTVSYKPVDDDKVNDILSKATRRTPNEIANLRDKVADVKLESTKQPFREHYNRLFKGREVI